MDEGMGSTFNLATGAFLLFITKFYVLGRPEGREQNSNLHEISKRAKFFIDSGSAAWPESVSFSFFLHNICLAYEEILKHKIIERATKPYYMKKNGKRYLIVSRFSVYEMNPKESVKYFYVVKN